MVKVQRAWNGNISRIDNFMSWLYENGMTKTEQDQKDRLFRKYYRFYNDGDIPRGMKYKLNCNVEQELEVQINEFISKMLKKYMSTERRRQFRKDQLDQDFNSTKALTTGKNRVPDLLDSYYSQQYAERYRLAKLKKVNDEIERVRKQLAQLEQQAGRMIVDHYTSHPLKEGQEKSFEINMYYKFH